MAQSVKRERPQSGWGFIVFANSQCEHYDSGAYQQVTSSMKMEIEAITRALRWIADHRAETTHAVVATDSMCTLKKIEGGLLRVEWMEAIRATAMMSITWIFCPGHAGVKGNEKADKLASEAVPIENAHRLQMDKKEAMSTLIKTMREEEDRVIDAMGYVLRMKEIGVKRGEGRKSNISGKTRRVSNQVKTGTLSMDTLRTILNRGTEHVWICPECKEVDACHK